MSNETTPNNLYIHVIQKEDNFFEIIVAVRDELNKVVTNANNEIDIIVFGANKFHKVFHSKAINGLVVLEVNCFKAGTYSITAKSKNLITAKSAFKVTFESRVEKEVKSLVTENFHGSRRHISPVNVSETPFDPTFFFTTTPVNPSVGQTFNFQIALNTRLQDYSDLGVNAVIPAHSMSHSAWVRVFLPSGKILYLSINSTSEYGMIYFDFFIVFTVPGLYLISASLLTRAAFLKFEVQGEVNSKGKIFTAASCIGHSV